MRVILATLGRAAVVVALTALATLPASAQGLITKKRLSAALAMEAVMEAVEVCKKAGYAVTAIVVDNEGVRQAVLRGDGAVVHTLDSAYVKAYTAASLAPVRKDGSTKAPVGAHRQDAGRLHRRAREPAQRQFHARRRHHHGGRRGDRRHRRGRRARRQFRSRLRGRGAGQDQGQDEVKGADRTRNAHRHRRHRQHGLEHRRAADGGRPQADRMESHGRKDQAAGRRRRRASQERPPS